jgi:hypothetical protein
MCACEYKDKRGWDPPPQMSATKFTHTHTHTHAHTNKQTHESSHVSRLSLCTLLSLDKRSFPSHRPQELVMPFAQSIQNKLVAPFVHCAIHLKLVAPFAQSVQNKLVAPFVHCTIHLKLVTPFVHCTIYLKLVTPFHICRTVNLKLRPPHLPHLNSPHNRLNSSISSTSS